MTGSSAQDLTKLQFKILTRLHSHLEAGSGSGSELMCLLAVFSSLHAPRLRASVFCGLLTGGFPQLLATWASQDDSSQHGIMLLQSQPNSLLARQVYNHKHAIPFAIFCWLEASQSPAHMQVDRITQYELGGHPRILLPRHVKLTILKFK